MTQLQYLTFGNKTLDLAQPHVMAVLNLTPDSFSDGGFFVDVDKAVDHALRMEDAGASFIDIGGESTRPGAESVSAKVQLERVMPVLQALQHRVSAVLSIDTSDPDVITETAAAGVGLINDVRALRQTGALAAAANTGLPVCLMHMQGEPHSMQADPKYNNVIDDVQQFLAAQILACQQSGIERAKILVDPGFGFGKTLQQNLLLLKNLQQLQSLKCPLLVGLSRKSMLGQILDKPVDERLFGSIAAAILACERGAKVVRVHDVAQTIDAIKIFSSVLQG